MTAEDLPETVRRDLEAIDAALAGQPVAPELTELGALALALRDERPAPSHAFTRDLDSRVAAGFPPRRRRLAALRSKLPSAVVFLPASAVTALVAVIVVLAAVSGDSGMSDSGSSSSSGGSSAASSESAGTAATDAGSGSAPDAERDAAGADSADSGAGAAPSLAAPVPQTGGSPRADGRDKRYVERSTAITLAARPSQIDEVADRIVGVADRAGGFVVSSNVTATDGTATDGGGDFLLRVPTARLQDAVAALSRIGHVRERRQTAEDITRERVSAADRLEEAEAERASLLRRLSTATTDAVTKSVQARLRVVNTRIAAAKTALSRVDNRARFATVAVTLVGDKTVGAVGGKKQDSGWSPGDATHDALRVLEVVAGVVLIALAIVVPVGLLVLLGALVARLAARRGRERVLDAV